MSSSPEILVFSDLDGTLLDHATYDWRAAQPALDRLREVGAGLVLASSKTAAEIAPLRKDVGFANWPSIVENGAGVVWPNQTEDDDNSPYLSLREEVRKLGVPFRGFGDMSTQEVCDRTGLSEPAAELARTRQFSEPGVWEGPEAELDTFLDQARAKGILAKRGGRFLTLSWGRTKADAMAEVISRLSPKWTIALGDAPNDIEMIEAANRGVIIKNPASKPLPPLPSEGAGRILRTQLPGPEGWSEAILSLLADVNLNEAGRV